ncbi:hypothetical protein BJ138DRAFT_1153966 [Hygrophoropsis aurantiaca]|uniref:Uncharacterized protein n=1 Tax=Hygrophoropsis aurantiaca TaxID=72124 RepID=A0ACB8A9D2_9AGAM|nr:hypothetical protein BJ138DRAFT_1153966 [Hygrophoropsis aurantiaca]
MSITSHINRLVRQSPKFPMVGTPLAVGAIRGRKSLSDRSYAIPVSSPLQSIANLTASSRKTVQSAFTLGEKTNARASDVEVAEFEKRELELLLEVTRCQRNIRSLENELADARLRENTAVGDLYKFRAEVAERKLEGAEFDLGRVRNTMRQNEVGRHVPKRRRLSGPRSEPSRISLEG